MSIIYRLRHHYPANWEEVPTCEYDKNKYVLRDVSTDCDEYVEVIERFKELPVKFQVSRVQYPAAYLRFKLKSELSTSEMTTEYILVKKTDMELVLRFNCDTRRCQGSHSTNLCDIMTRLREAQDMVLIVHQFRKMGKYDDDRYPTYTVNFTQNGL